MPVNKGAEHWSVTRFPPIEGFYTGVRERSIAHRTHPSPDRKKRMSILTISVKRAAIGLLVSTAMTGAANAASSYGYSTLHFQNFILTGIVDANGTPAAGVVFFNSSVTSTDGANYPGFAAGGTSSSGNLFSGTDPALATSGPGPFPAENTFTQALTGSPGTRGDAQITGAIASGATSNLVSEGNLTTSGSAGSYSSTSTTINLLGAAGIHYIGLDNVSLTQTGGFGGVPEPATWGLMLTGFFGMGAMLRRRRYMALAA